MKMKRLFLTLTVLLAVQTLVFAQKADAILGKWYNTEKDAQIEIFKEAGKYHGKIVWLKEPTENGKPKLDKNNTDPSKRNQAIMGMKLLHGFEFKGQSWEEGNIYDPKNGKTYSCIIKRKSERLLEVRGYVGVSLIGRTVEWSRVE